MARRQRQRSRHAYPNPLQTLAIYLIATAEDADDENIALAVAHLALEQHKSRQGGKYGLRGTYGQSTKTEEFFRLILEEFTDRQFKEWFRQITVRYFIYI